MFIVSTVLIFAQAPRVFDPAKLTEDECRNIQLFKEKKGQVRFDEFMKIKHIFPTCESISDSSGSHSLKEETLTKIMTKDQLEALIGKPDFENGSYEIGERKCDCEVFFSINSNNQVLNFIFANCRKYFNI